jgi:predicted PurR-regulated permease PerM
VLTHYAGAQVRISLILTGLYAAGFLLLRVPWWPLFALLCGMANLIPIFGTLIAAVVTAAVTWIARGWEYGLGVMAVFAAVQGFEGFYLTPRILGRSLRLPPLAVFAALLIAGALFGFLGLLLVVPVIALAMALWKLRG